MVQGKITEADTPTIRLGATPSVLISDPPPSSSIFTLDALPAATLPLYPGLGQAPNTLACIPSVLVQMLTKTTKNHYHQVWLKRLIQNVNSNPFDGPLSSYTTFSWLVCGAATHKRLAHLNRADFSTNHTFSFVHIHFHTLIHSAIQIQWV